MKYPLFHKSLAIIFFLLATLAVSGQDKTVVKASVDKKAILIGEQIVLKLDADIPQDQPIRFFQLDSIAHFEILNAQKIDTANTQTGTQLSQAIHITSFDSGHWVIPQLLLGDSILTDSIPIDVSFTPFDTTKPYNDIKEIIEVNPVVEKPDYTWWYIAGGALIALIIAVIMLRKKKKPVVVAAPVITDPFKQAMSDITALQSKKVETKAFYTELVTIFRIYVKDSKGIHSLQQTTDDLVKQLRQLALGKKEFEDLSQALSTSDFVKFAKYIPSKEDDQFSFNTIKKSIQLIEELRT